MISIPTQCLGIRAFAMALLAAVSISSVSAPAYAQTYPTKAVKLINPFQAGGNADVVLRKLAEALGRKWGQPVIVDYATGASGNVGAQVVAGAEPDGYTLLFFSHPILTVNPWVIRAGAYNAERDLLPVVRVSDTVNVLMASNKLPANSVRDVIALGKAKPRTLNFGNGGTGTTTHLAAEKLTADSGIEVLHIPYRGSASAGLALIAGEIDLEFEAVSSGVARAKAGQAKLLGIGGAKRLSFMPDVPTIAESGLPGFESILALGIAAPAKTPKAVLQEINTRVNEVLSDPAMKAFLQSQGSEAVGGSMESFGTFISSDRAQWGRLIRERNIVLQ